MASSHSNLSNNNTSIVQQHFEIVQQRFEIVQQQLISRSSRDFKQASTICKNFCLVSLY